jgi:hypothetical protein
MLAISVRSSIMAALVPSDSSRCRPHIERVFERGLVAHWRIFFKPASSNTTLLTLRSGGPANCAHTLRTSEHMPLMPGGSEPCSSRVVGVSSSAPKRVTLAIDKTIPGPPGLGEPVIKDSDGSRGSARATAAQRGQRVQPGSAPSIRACEALWRGSDAASKSSARNDKDN